MGERATEKRTRAGMVPFIIIGALPDATERRDCCLERKETAQGRKRTQAQNKRGRMLCQSLEDGISGESKI